MVLVGAGGGLPATARPIALTATEAPRFAGDDAVVSGQPPVTPASAPAPDAERPVDLPGIHNLVAY